MEEREKLAAAKKCPASPWPCGGCSGLTSKACKMRLDSSKSGRKTNDSNYCYSDYLRDIDYFQIDGIME